MRKRIKIRLQRGNEGDGQSAFCCWVGRQACWPAGRSIILIPSISIQYLLALLSEAPNSTNRYGSLCKLGSYRPVKTASSRKKNHQVWQLVDSGISSPLLETTPLRS